MTHIAVGAERVSTVCGNYPVTYVHMLSNVTADHKCILKSLHTFYNTQNCPKLYHELD